MIGARGAASLVALPTLVGCTLALPVDKQQCARDADCAAYGPQYASFSCVASWCEPASCSQDADCRARGGELANDICSVEQRVCLDPAACERDADCRALGAQYADFQCRAGSCVEPLGCDSTDECRARGGPYAQLVCIEGWCDEAGCDGDAQCGHLGPHYTCEEGRCVDLLWGCLGRVEAPPDPAPATLVYRTPVVDLLSRQTPPGLQILACLRPDPECAQPVATTFTSAGENMVDIELPNPTGQGFDGFLRVSAEGLLPSYFHFIKPLLRSNTDKPAAEIVLFSADTVATLSAAAMRQVDLNLGVVLLRAHDCQDRPAAGVAVAPSPAGSSFFFAVDESNLPDPNATATNSAGIAGIANLPIGFSNITLTVEDTQQTLLSFSVLLKPNAITLANYRP